MIYAGIGSRDLQTSTYWELYSYGKALAKLDATLRSGGANGADTAFEQGCDQHNGKKEIYLPWKGFNSNGSELYDVTESALRIAADIYGPTWNRQTQTTQKFMGRNVYQVLGLTLDQPVDFVICWTSDGCESREYRTRKTGGTGQAIALASDLGLPVFNLSNGRERLIDYLQEVMEYE